jgi:hypothetical protein
MAADWYSEQPRNRNFLTPVGFRLDLEIFDGVDFFCQSASIPELSAPFAEVPTPYRNVPIVASGGTNFGDLVLRFIVDEDLVNYKSIHDWIRKYTLSDGRSDEADLYSSARLFILTSHNNSSHYVEFNNIFPINITGIPFDSTVSDIDYLSAEVIFKYESYNIIPIVQPDFTSAAAPLTVSLSSNVTDILDPNEPFNLTYNSSGAVSLVIDNGIGVVQLRAGTISVQASSALQYLVDTTPLTGAVTYTITATSESGSIETSTTTINMKKPQTSSNRICIGVCDESDSQSFAGMEGKWVQFRNNWPGRTFYLLRPGTGSNDTLINDMRCPVSFLEETSPTSIGNP